MILIAFSIEQCIICLFSGCPSPIRRLVHSLSLTYTYLTSLMLFSMDLSCRGSKRSTDLMSIFRCVGHAKEFFQVRGSVERFITVFLCGGGLLDPCPTPKPEGYPMLAVCDRLFSIFAATLQTWMLSPSFTTWGCVMQWCQGIHLTWKANEHIVEMLIKLAPRCEDNASYLLQYLTVGYYFSDFLQFTALFKKLIKLIKIKTNRYVQD
jgi:hypothetical protein